jgi:hypothetical protein
MLCTTRVVLSGSVLCIGGGCACASASSCCVSMYCVLLKSGLAAACCIQHSLPGAALRVSAMLQERLYILMLCCVVKFDSWCAVTLLPPARPGASQCVQLELCAGWLTGHDILGAVFRLCKPLEAFTWAARTARTQTQTLCSFRGSSSLFA